MEKIILDISTYQTITDVDKLVANCDGIILRLGFTGSSSGTPTLDSKFKEHFEKLKGKIPLGLYYFTLASNSNMVKMETDWVISQLAEIEKDGYRFELPIWVDAEKYDSYTFGKTWTALGYMTRSKLMLEWVQTLADAGYYCGIYAGVRGYHRQPYFLDKSTLKNVDKWTAQYNSICQWDGIAGVDYHIWQYTSNADTNKYGIKSSGLDANKCYVDYPTVIKEYGLNHITKEVTQENIQSNIKLLKITIGADVLYFPAGTTIKIEYT